MHRLCNFKPLNDKLKPMLGVPNFSCHLFFSPEQKKLKFELTLNSSSFVQVRMSLSNESIEHVCEENPKRHLKISRQRKVKSILIE